VQNYTGAIIPQHLNDIKNIYLLFLNILDGFYKFSKLREGIYTKNLDKAYFNQVFSVFDNLVIIRRLL